MILDQHYLGCLAQASYLIGDPTTGAAAVVDPRRDVDDYLDEAARHGLRIEHVVLTHFHADFVSGHLELRDRTGAKIWLGARADAAYDHESFADGDEIALGDVRLRCLETPGHTPESICVLVFDGASPEPHAVLTGDTLFIGDVGRPDLMASVGHSAEELGGMLYDSLHRKLLTLPDATLVYPGHGAGSMCGKNLSSETASTIGDQRSLNYALQPMGREEFVALVAAGQPKTPAYFPENAKLNRAQRGSLDDVVRSKLRPLAIDEVLRLRVAGHVVLDCRPHDDFVAKHLEHSVWIGLDGKFATWAGTVLPLDQPVVLLTAPGDEQQAAIRLGRIGHDAIAGYVDGGFAAVERGGAPLESFERVDAAALRTALAGAEPPHVVDIRSPSEWEAGHIDGAQHVPLIDLEQRLDELPAGADLVLVCGSSYRSLIALSLLERRGIAARDLVGGMSAWGGTACSA